MMHHIKYALGLATFVLFGYIIVTALSNDVSVKVRPSMGFAPLDIRVEAHVNREQADRVLIVSVVDDAGIPVSSSAKQLDASSATVHTYNYLRLNPGEYQVTATVLWSTGKARTTSAPLKVIGYDE